MNAVEGKTLLVQSSRIFEVVLDAKTMAATPAYALGELRTALALYRSIESGRWEKVW
ncbi:MAG: hypothetical protein CM15mP120_18990 [Pseudomonadota bacterium]|nr:MAG: hypothetical protein CM15mP120_18990 [Pseudomonadota bacterium]